MNKILPIILAVVLSGNADAGWFDGKTPLENCADSEYNWASHVERESKPNQKYLKILKYFEKNENEFKGPDNKWKRKRYLKRNNIEYAVFKEYWINYINNIKERSEKLESLPVEKKLKMSRGYFHKYVRCEKEREHYPATFDAKWK